MISSVPQEFAVSYKFLVHSPQADGQCLVSLPVHRCLAFPANMRENQKVERFRTRWTFEHLNEITGGSPPEWVAAEALQFMSVQQVYITSCWRSPDTPTAGARLRSIPRPGFQAKRTALNRVAEMIFPQEREVTGIEDPHRAVGSQGSVC